MVTRYVDTSALLDPGFMLQDGDVIIAAVLMELDNLKNSPGETGFEARRALRALWDGRENLVLTDSAPGSADLAFLSLGEVGELVTRDRGLGLLAMACGWTVTLRGNASEAIPTSLPETPSANCSFYAEPYGKTSSLYHREDGFVEPGDVPRPLGIKARGQAQRAALYAMATKELAILHGPAGTGKTLLAMAAALQALQDGVVEDVLVIRPVVPVGRDLGYLPGTLEEKMTPWTGAVGDALDVLHPHDALLGAISVAPPTHLRGRSLRSTWVVVDEAQNLSPHEIKTILTRLGSGCFATLTGDPGQIDSPGLGRAHNGLCHAIRRLDPMEGCDVVPLDKPQRSAVAAEAADRL